MTRVITVAGKITENGRRRLRAAILAKYPDAKKIHHSYGWCTSSFHSSGSYFTIAWEDL